MLQAKLFYAPRDFPAGLTRCSDTSIQPFTGGQCTSSVRPRSPSFPTRTSFTNMDGHGLEDGEHAATSSERRNRECVDDYNASLDVRAETHKMHGAEARFCARHRPSIGATEPENHPRPLTPQRGP